ncbi:unnamed protein product [Camellia sinensis]
MTILHQLKLNSRTNRNTVIPVTKRYESRTIHIQMVLPGDESPYFKSHPSIHPDIDQHRSRHLILGERLRQERRHRDGVSVQKRRPNVLVLVALIGRGEESGESDLLASIACVDIELVVVDSDSIVGVAGGESDLEIGCEEIGGGGDVEGVDGGVEEDESGFGGAEDDPDQEYDDED